MPFIVYRDPALLLDCMMTDDAPEYAISMVSELPTPLMPMMPTKVSANDGAVEDLLHDEAKRSAVNAAMIIAVVEVV